MSKEFRVQGNVENLVKVYLNDKDDYTYINEKDSGIFDRFTGFINWLDKKGAELQKQETAIRQKYGKSIIQYDDAGEVEEINATALCELSEMRTGAFRETVAQLDGIFGEGTIRKYFYRSYEVNPEFVPDDECIYDFMEAVTPILNEIFSDRRKRIDLKYNKSRKGGKGNQYRGR